MTLPSADPRRSYPWRQAFRAALLWLVGCSTFGFIVASVNGEHGSIIFLGYGIFVGLAGGISHVALLAIQRIRSLNKLPRALVLSCATTILMLVYAACEVASNPTSNVLAYTEALTLVLTFGFVPSFIAAFAVVWLTENAA